MGREDVGYRQAPYPKKYSCQGCSVSKFDGMNTDLAAGVIDLMSE